MNKDKQPENLTDREQEARRKLIKGMAGLPAVFTLSSGAHAATASALECLGRGQPNPSDITANTPSPTSGTTNVRNCLPIGGGAGEASAYSPAQPNLYVANDGAARLENVGGTGETTATGLNQACVTYVDGTGTHVTFDNNVPNTQATFASCYASIDVSNNL